MSVSAAPRALGAVPLDRVLPALRALEPGARACWAYDLDALSARAKRFQAAFAAMTPLVAFALKANALPAIIETLRDAGLGAEAGSIGELEMARAAGVPAAARLLSGNARTPEEAAWAVRHGVHSVNADHPGELDVLERAAAESDASLNVALRVNPGIDAGGHPYIAVGHGEAKFGVAPEDALEAWQSRARWPHLRLEGLHLHVGSQLRDAEALERAAAFALGLADASASRGAPLTWIDLGGGFGIDYSGGVGEFPLERYAAWLVERVHGRPEAWVLEPGRWLVAPIGVLLAEVLAVKQRGGKRFVAIAAGLNDLLRPALYGARHRIVPIAPRAGDATPAAVVGPVCESSDVFAADVTLPPVEPGDVLAVLDTGAYGATMSSNYNGRLRLAELVTRGGELRRARAGETLDDLRARSRDDALSWRPS